MCRRRYSAPKTLTHWQFISNWNVIELLGLSFQQNAVHEMRHSFLLVGALEGRVVWTEGSNGMHIRSIPCLAGRVLIVNVSSDYMCSACYPRSEDMTSCASVWWPGTRDIIPGSG